MRERIVRYGLGLAALAAVASPIVLILLLDPRVDLLRRHAAPAADSVPAAAEPCPACALPAPRPAPAPPPELPLGPPADAPAAGAIQTPDVAPERAAQRERLIGWTAHPDRVAGSAARLDLIGLLFTAPRPPEPDATASRAPGRDDDAPRTPPGRSAGERAGYRAGYRPVNLDLARAPERAVVVLAEQPVAWSVTTAPPDRAGAFGVESTAPFALRDGRPGLLAGFRVQAFGAPQVAPVLDPHRFGPGTLRAFCAALRLWAVQFGLPLERARYTLLENPTRVALDGGRIRSDGIARGRVSGPRLARLCRA
ncbi:hypothetical protein OPKNFCMD_1181 [Methylobacterium crusticola]|uniref:Uncharacterized protein n=2 Tax=Methylobacterium crusticola TaxID=1697972 RepID=A0ABQ4QT12_9HYPH|nr:hypothetical protein [Methylobacterium crusticola]GJD48462.1 hypothetical protein OPKNFCMD_1181 [Methylobacterium crusticola]